MDIFEETKAPLIDIWENHSSRQKAKTVILQAIANVSEVTVKQADEILDEMDRMLLKEEETNNQRLEKGL